MDASNHGMIEEVCVMLIDDDTEFVTKLTNLLKAHNCKVTTADMTSTTMLMVSKEKQKIDVMILNIHSSNIPTFDLLAQAVALDIISLVVCDDYNELEAKKILDMGEYLYLQKPFDENLVKYLWQFVWRKRIQKEKAKEGSIADNDMGGENEEQFEKKKDVSNTEVVRLKDYTKWTDDLHVKFMKAVVIPRKILHVMNLPGLTRMQVACHLQRCRRNNWRSPKERKNIHRQSGQGYSSVSHEPKSSFQKFGRMPNLQANVSNQQRNQDQIRRSPEFSLPTLNINNIFAQGDLSIQQLYHPQLKVQPHYLGIGHPFYYPFSSAQNNTGGEIKQQHNPIFGMLGSQEQEDPIMKNTHYRPNSVLNSEDHHSEKEHNFLLNVAKGATNTNANFQQYQGSNSCNLGPSGANLFNEQDSEFDQVYSDDQNLGPPDANLPNEQGSEFDQVYSDD
ncbi:two-component response regulator ORR26-like [Solanum pennellii]|uniref:Two-component response regulator ORR26-like n=1 Tax=Solanum pennellii TaxID=28526 RepID=A0ABM1FIU5_SOLPN|nr:two-component response regulator ORR26-like [Solanum pennellii]